MLNCAQTPAFVRLAKGGRCVQLSDSRYRPNGSKCTCKFFCAFFFFYLTVCSAQNLPKHVLAENWSPRQRKIHWCNRSRSLRFCLMTNSLTTLHFIFLHWYTRAEQKVSQSDPFICPTNQNNSDRSNQIILDINIDASHAIVNFDNEPTSSPIIYPNEGGMRTCNSNLSLSHTSSARTFVLLFDKHICIRTHPPRCT
jgi:hypothetical protein